MGKLQDMREAARRQAQEATARSAMAPVLEEMRAILAEVRRIAEEIREVPGRIEAGEAGRAERLRDAVLPLATATREAAAETGTEISGLRAEIEGLRDELRRTRLEPAREALRRELEEIAEEVRVRRGEIAALPDALAGEIDERLAAIEESLPRRLAGTAPGRAGSNGGVPTGADAETLRTAEMAWRILLRDADQPGREKQKQYLKRVADEAKLLAGARPAGRT